MSNDIPAHELRSPDNDDLVAKLKKSKEELFNLRFQNVTGRLTNNRRLRTVRRDIAHIYTVMCERKLGLSAAPTDGDTTWVKKT